jgi:lambda family phage portal protein
MQNRAVIQRATRGYDAATKSRYRDPWYSRGASADTEISRAGGTLRAQMRDLVRNNPHAANAVHGLVTHAVGAGIVPRAKDKRVNDLFAEWSKKCDAAGHLDFYGIQALAVREMIETGDGLVRKRIRRAGDELPVALQIQVLEIDHLDTTRNWVAGAGNIIQGIELSPIDKPVAYWLYPSHPGAMHSGTGQGSLESRPVPMADLAHCFEKQRTQSRGVPWGTPAMAALRDLAEYETAEIVRKKMEACVVGVVVGGDDEMASVTGTPDDDDISGVYNSDGEIVEKLSPGGFFHARGGKDIKFTTPAATGGYDSYKTSMLHTVAAGFRVPYSLLSGNLSRVNYSSGKMGLETYKRTIDAFQWDIIIPMLLEPIWRWFCEAAYAEGKIDQKYIPVEWSPPKFPSADEARDIAATVAAVRAGIKSPLHAIAETGWTPDEILEDFKAWHEKLDSSGMVFDSDPRRMSQAGQTQQGPPDAEPPDKDEET